MHNILLQLTLVCPAPLWPESCATPYTVKFNSIHLELHTQYASTTYQHSKWIQESTWELIQ